VRAVADSPLRDRMIFVVGARRSGTNWLQRILCAHGDVVGVPSETYLFAEGISRLATLVHHGISSSPDTGAIFMERDDFVDAARQFCDRVFMGLLGDSAALPRRIVERTPWHVHHLELIGAVYPDAWVVNIVRDGRAVVRSLHAQPWGPATIEEAVAEWCAAVRDARAAAPRLCRYVEVRYEELLADTPAGIRALYERLDLDPTAAAVERAREEAAALFNVDASTPWIGADKWRDTLSPRDLATIERLAGDELTRLGYEVTGDSGRRRRPRIAGRPRRRDDASRRRAHARSANEDLERVRETQILLNDIVEAINTEQYDALTSRLADDAFVHIAQLDHDWSGRATEGRERLVRALQDDAPLRGRQVRSAIQPGVLSATALITYEGRDGVRSEQAVLITVEGGMVTRLRYHRFC
jgi:hypothetical protein